MGDFIRVRLIGLGILCIEKRYTLIVGVRFHGYFAFTF